MRIIKKLAIIILIAQQTLLVSMHQDPCSNGKHDDFKRIQIIPHAQCSHINRCGYCCESSQRYIITQCRECGSWDANVAPIPKAVLVHFDPTFRRTTTKEEELLWACNMNEDKRVDALIEEGIDPNIRSFIFPANTALIIAARKGNTQIAKTLLDAGASPDKLTTLGTTALIEAIDSNAYRETTHKEIVQLLLDKHANPDLHAFEIATPLIVALRSINAKENNIPEILLKAGANPNHQPAYMQGFPIISYSPLSEAGWDTNMIKLLKQYGAVEKRAAL